jgi:pimeloyl-ACP methyl ester carboxylesterase
MLTKTKPHKEAISEDAPRLEPFVPQVAPPEATYHFIDLPLTQLHYVKCGEGPPLIIVPATISEIDNWLPLIQFMGQRFTAYFFELPGHGQSTPFKGQYTSEKVAQTIEDLINTLGHERVNIMGFSFGGILTMKAVHHLNGRLDRVLLLSPVTVHNTILFSKLRKFSLLATIKILSIPQICRAFTWSLQQKFLSNIVIAFFRWIGRVEESVPLERRLREITGTTIEVLTHQLEEILTMKHVLPPEKFKQPCYFAMSVIDPLLDFETTLDVIYQQFEKVRLEKFYFPYHQPKVLPTYEEYNRDFSQFISLLE